MKEPSPPKRGEKRENESKKKREKKRRGSNYEKRRRRLRGAAYRTSISRDKTAPVSEQFTSSERLMVLSSAFLKPCSNGSRRPEPLSSRSEREPPVL